MIDNEGQTATLYPTSALTAARAILENRSFAPHSFIGLDRCREVSLGPQTSV